MTRCKADKCPDNSKCARYIRRKGVDVEDFRNRKEMMRGLNIERIDDFSDMRIDGRCTLFVEAV